MKKLIGLALVALLGIALPAKDLEVMAVYYPHWHKYPKGIEWFSEKWDWSEAEWAFVKDPVVRFPGQINFKPFGGYYSGSDPKDVETEIALAANAGIDIFLYDYYWYNGEKTQEEAIEQGFLKAKNRDKMKFALMWCYHDRKKSSWRKRLGDESVYCMRLARKPEEFQGLIDYSIAHYFNQPEHWRHNGKIFFSIYNAWDMIKDYGEEGTKSALLEARRRETAERCGFDSLTSYGCNTYSLPNHRQRYAAGERLFDFAEAEKVLDAKWKTMSSISKLPYYPIVPTGWDSSLRCAKDEKFPWPGPEVDYPYCGIFTNATDALFEKYLRRPAPPRDRPRVRAAPGRRVRVHVQLPFVGEEAGQPAGEDHARARRRKREVRAASAPGNGRLVPRKGASGGGCGEASRACRHPRRRLERRRPHSRRERMGTYLPQGGDHARLRGLPLHPGRPRRTSVAARARAA